MDRSGSWSLSPAFDVTYSYNPSGAWTGSHQMSMNGKRDLFGIEDFRACAKLVSMKRGRAEEILYQVQAAVLKWPQFANEAGIDVTTLSKISKAHRTDILT